VSALYCVPGTIQSFPESFGAERLQQIVDCVDVEGADRVLVVGRNEDDVRLASDQIEPFESVQARHLDIQQQKIRLQVGDRFDSLETIPALGNDFKIEGILKVFTHE